MLRTLRKWTKYYGKKADLALEERADPKVQLEQAIAEAHDQHRRLREQAANVIASQRQSEMKLNRTLEEFERVQGNTRQALVMADEAARKGDPVKEAAYTNAAEAFANRLIVLEREIEDLKALVLQSAEASQQAKAAVAQNSAMLQRKLSERQKLMSQLEQAKMQEQLNTAMASLSEVVGGDVPSFEEVRQKIEARYAKAKASGELTGSGVDARMLEIEQAAANTEAKGRLERLRSEMGLAPAGELGAGPSTDPLLAEAEGLHRASGSPTLEK
jgi:phage shock protein A